MRIKSLTRGFAYLLLASVAWVMADRFDLSLLLDDTILTGGDSASWHQVALHLENNLFSRGRLLGWDQANFLGYPDFQFYFPLPFMLVVILGQFIPLTVALKLVTVVGLAGLPFAVYWMLRKLRYSTTSSLIGTLLMLIFLFQERYTMFGGNILSTLAGEFAYSFAFMLLPIFIGLLHHGMQKRSYAITAGLLLALIGLSHAFVFLVAVFAPVYLFLSRRPSKPVAGFIVRLYLFGFLFMAFWVLPMLAQLEFTTPVRMIWIFTSLEQLLSAVNYEVLSIAAVVTCLVLVLHLPARHVGFYLYMIGVSTLIYLAAPLLNVPDIRFFPPILFFALLLIVDGAESLLRVSRYAIITRVAMMCLALLSAGLWVYEPTLQSPGWWRWNYSGYEHKPAFTDASMERLGELLAVAEPAPRVAWEKAPYNNEYGSDRVFENLELLTGRRGLEGIHYSAALLSKPLTWMLGEYSLTAASPQSLVYAHYDVGTLPRRFRLFNIAELITGSKEMKQLLEASDDFERLGEAGGLTVFRLRDGGGGYVETPRRQPILVDLDDDNWKARYYAWFQHPENLDQPIVSNHFVEAAERQTLFAGRDAEIDFRGRFTRVGSVIVPPARVSEQRVDDMSIEFRTDSPGQPHIVKVAYSPNWRSSNGEPVYPVSPGLMLIYPATDHVTLEYGRHPAQYLGLALTAFGVAGGIGLLWFQGRRKIRIALVDHLLGALCSYRWLLGALLLGFMVSAAIYGSYLRQESRGDYRSGLSLQRQGDLAAAEHAFLRASSVQRMRRYPQNPDIPHAMTALAWLYTATGRNEKALATYHQILEHYPNWIFIHKIHDGIARIHEQAHRYRLALTSYRSCAQLDLYSEIGIQCAVKRRELEEQLEESR